MLAAATTALLVASGLTAAGAAPAEITTCNPFTTNNGFSIVAKGNATLGNHEIEGSIAAFGSIAATSSNYPLVHKVAGWGTTPSRRSTATTSASWPVPSSRPATSR